MFRLLHLLLNYFYLDMDEVKSAAAYCDQHVFKIHSELVESVWDAFAILDPSVEAEADELGLPKSYRRHRHQGPDRKSHPLIRWNALARANTERTLLNAKALFEEHLKRTGVRHKAYWDWEFLVDVLPRVPYEGEAYDAFLHRECLSDAKAIEWYRAHSVPYGDGYDFTNPPRCINAKLFPGCDSPSLVGAYRQYYQLKSATVKAGKEVGFRYFYSAPPLWLRCTFFTRRGGKTVRVTRKSSGSRVVDVIARP